MTPPRARQVLLTHGRVAACASRPQGSLLLAGLDLEALPPQLAAGHHTALTALDLSRNALRETGGRPDPRRRAALSRPRPPGALAHLPGLTRLDLAANRLRACPEELSGLLALVHLDLSRNDLRTLAGLGPLGGLEALPQLSNYQG